MCTKDSLPNNSHRDIGSNRQHTLKKTENNPKDDTQFKYQYIAHLGSVPSAGNACCEFSATTGMCCCCWSVAAIVRTTGDEPGSAPTPLPAEATGVTPPPVPAVPATMADIGVVTPTPSDPERKKSGKVMITTSSVLFLDT